MFRLKRGKFGTVIMSVLEPDMLIGLNLVDVNVEENEAGSVSERDLPGEIVIPSQNSKWEAMNSRGNYARSCSCTRMSQSYRVDTVFKCDTSKLSNIHYETVFCFRNVGKIYKVIKDRFEIVSIVICTVS